MLDCATRVPNQQAVGGGYYPRYVYSQPADFSDSAYPVKAQPKDFHPASQSPPSQYPPSPETVQQQTTVMSSSNPVYSPNPGQNYYTNCLFRNYQQGLSAGNIFNSNPADTAAKTPFSSVPPTSQYLHPTLSRENSVHQSPTGSVSSTSYSPSPVDTKPYQQTALYWPTGAPHYDYDYISKSADYVLQQMHHQQGELEESFC